MHDTAMRTSRCDIIGPWQFALNAVHRGRRPNRPARSVGRFRRRSQSLELAEAPRASPAKTTARARVKRLEELRIDLAYDPRAVRGDNDSSRSSPSPRLSLESLRKALEASTLPGRWCRPCPRGRSMSAPRATGDRDARQLKPARMCVCSPTTERFRATGSFRQSTPCAVGPQAASRELAGARWQHAREEASSRRCGVRGRPRGDLAEQVRPTAEQQATFADVMSALRRPAEELLRMRDRVLTAENEAGNGRASPPRTRSPGSPSSKPTASPSREPRNERRRPSSSPPRRPSSVKKTHI